MHVSILSRAQRPDAEDFATSGVKQQSIGYRPTTLQTKLVRALGGATVALACSNICFEGGRCTMSPLLRGITPFLPPGFFRGAVGTMAYIAHVSYIDLAYDEMKVSRPWVLIHAGGAATSMVCGVGAAFTLWVGQTQDMWSCAPFDTSQAARLSPITAASVPPKALTILSAVVATAQLGAMVGGIAGTWRLGSDLFCRVALGLFSTPAKASRTVPVGRQRRHCNRMPRRTPRGASIRPQQAGDFPPPPASAIRIAPHIVSTPGRISAAAAPPCRPGPRQLLDVLAAVGASREAQTTTSKDPAVVRAAWEMIEEMAAAPAGVDALIKAARLLSPAHARLSEAGWNVIVDRCRRKPTGRLSKACRQPWGQALRQFYAGRLEATRIDRS